MRGWIIYKDCANLLKPERYEIDRFMEEAAKQNIQLEVYAPEDFDLEVTQGGDRSILLHGERVSLPDFVLPRMGSSTTYFALALIRHLERLGVYVVNQSHSIEAVKDKLFTQQILAQENLPTPNTMLVKFPVDVDLVKKSLGFPVVIKTLSGTQGSGVFLSKDASEFNDLMQLIEATAQNANIILQEFIKASHGRDLRVFTIGGRAVACFERIAKDGDFKANYSNGGSLKPAEMTPEIEWLATQCSRAVGLDVAGIDLLFDKDHFKICEANSSPGFEGLEKVVDINIPQEIFHFIRIRLGLFDNPTKSQKNSAA
ncbi:RimK family alpha-L-glutamate ligase [Ferrimonas balearica]|uniref:ATP-grasp domain-containing protein n=1 Tax=Ferrimonas balearica TaxID=44012 RepID=UPI001C9971B4|nr:RimK family alpha-L-glutamate ligase [Ferrimonas balearica]MBY5922358.1 RimK family alpha-L-glutamate ligase [Ferrimonas balearica]MBY5995342.1 RimK family alpha-L-glutamate ligase [Ferrimonas balearica]